MRTRIDDLILYDGKGGRQEAACVLFDEKGIVAAGRGLKDAQAETVIDGKGLTCTPGWVQGHTHIAVDGLPNMQAQVARDDTEAAVMASAARNSLRCLKSGLVAARDMGTNFDVSIKLRDAINAGKLLGPRIYASGRVICMTGGHGYYFGIEADGPDEARKAARAQIKRGADLIKIMATGGGNSPGPGTVSQLTEEEMRVAVEEAANRNALTAAHAIGADGIKRALRAGVRTIEHASFLDDEGIELLLKGDHYLVPTLCAFRTIKYGPEGGVPDYVLEKIHYFATAHYAGLEKAYKAGVKIVCGTDTGTPFNCHGDGAEELEMYTKLCMTPMEAIKTATSMAAQALRQPDIGVLAAGKTADLLVVDGDVLANIALLQDKSKLAIYHNGLAVNNT